MDREDLLLVRNNLILDQSALHLVNLTYGMVQVHLNRGGGYLQRLQLSKGQLHPRDQFATQGQVRLHLGHIAPPTTSAHLLECRLYLVGPESTLAPALNLMLRTDPGQHTQQTLHRIPKQIYIRGPVYMRRGDR